MANFYVEHQTWQTHNEDDIVNVGVRWQVLSMQRKPLGKTKEMITEQYR
jgi:hypothetical protein